tara:strand:- start:1127 stop:1882 length:756 start_codon:yes stop_codon:yes gene_type:complete
MYSISMSCLGNYGRFGNQLFQYAFAKSYAMKNGYELQIPKDWIGRALFDIADPELRDSFAATGLDQRIEDQHSIDLHGFYQHQDFLNIMDSDTVRSFFKFKDVWVDMFPKVKPYYIACHLRRGDYVNNPHFPVIHEKSYLDAVEKYGYSLDDIIFVGEEIKQPNDTRNYSSDKSFHGNIDFLYDFFLLLNADVLFRSNSTFGWWGSFLSKNKTFSPIIQGRQGEVAYDIEFVEGNHPCHQEIDNRHSDLKL